MFDSIDKTIIHKQQKLKELDKLEQEANRTMDHKLRKEWKQDQKKYRKLFF